MDKKEFLKMIKYGEVDDSEKFWSLVYDQIFNDDKIAGGKEIRAELVRMGLLKE
jgi:hypothetical protein